MRLFRAWRARTFASLSDSRNYRIFCCGQVVSIAGTWMQDAALPWLVLRQSGSAVDVGVLIFCRFLPALLLTLYSGVLADRFDNRRLMIASEILALAVAGTLTLMVAVGWTPLAAIFVLAVLGGTAITLEGPNRHALTFQLVGRGNLANAVGLNSSMFNAGRAVGPAIGGVVIATLGVGWCFALNALSYLGILIALLLIRRSELHPVARRGTVHALTAVREALAFTRRRHLTLVVITMFFVGSVFGFNFPVLVPVLADVTFDASATTFGILFGCFGFGALFGALTTATRGAASLRAFLIGSLMFNGAVLLIAPLRSAALAGVLLIVAGMGFSTWWATGQSILQLTTPDELRGRVISLYLFVFGGFQPVGALIAGWLAEHGGTELAYAVAGGTGLLATAIAAVALRHVSVMPYAPPDAGAATAPAGHAT